MRGGVGTYHHWGEPFYGYYYSDDEWVVRHHMKLIMQADIDFLFFDTTNALMYEHNSSWSCACCRNTTTKAGKFRRSCSTPIPPPARPLQGNL